MPAPDKIHELVELFKANYDSYHASKYNEAAVRHQFIDPLFMALGWDVNNDQGYSEAYKDVVHEDTVKVGTTSKAPDYSFRVGGTRKFFLEAKKPSVNIKDDPAPAFQLRRYGWSAKLPLSILTDFEELAVYDCRIKPEQNDKSSTARVKYYRYEDFIEKWDEIEKIFSREAVLKGSFDKYADDAKLKRGTTEVDNAFLREIESWREILSKNIALRNSGLTQQELNDAVQRTIDRIIFLRICEDRQIESYGVLRSLSMGTQVYSRLGKVFKEADDRYNSGLFHFKKEKGRKEEPDNFTLDLVIDDKILSNILGNLYYPASPYEFSVLPADILGQVYEQFLGKIIVLNDKHKASIEEKLDVRKAGGVYYTPTYIVKYIINTTLDSLVENKTLAQVSGLETGSPIRILDPACGSGSFLIETYQYFLNWYLNWYVTNNPEKHAKLKKPPIYRKGENWTLTVDERKKILLNHIYGIDIDSQAVEVTKLSLLLKTLEGENNETLKSQALLKDRILPDLDNNIKNGNSLIEFDFYDEFNISLFEDEEILSINPFNWKEEFGTVFKDGGFDAVVGNPPWGATFRDQEKDYLRSKFSDIHVRTPESYNYFIKQIWSLLSETGRAGIIIPSSFLKQHEFWKTRKFIVDNASVERLCLLGDGVFSKVTAPSCIISFTRGKEHNHTLYLDLQNYERSGMPIALKDEKDAKIISGLGGDDKEYGFQNRESDSLFFKCYKWPTLKSVAEEVATGISSGLDKAFVYTPADVIELSLEEDLLRKIAIGGEITRYSFHPVSGKKIIYTTSNTSLKTYPNYKKVLKQHKEALSERREAKNGKIPWFSLNWPRRQKLFDNPKIMIRQTSSNIQATLDLEQWYALKSVIIIQLPEDSNINYNYLLGILNSSLMDYLYQDLVGERGRVFPEVKPIQLFKLPIRIIDPSNKKDIDLYNKLSDLVEKIILAHKLKKSSKTTKESNIRSREIVDLDKKINSIVYLLYKLDENEISIIEAHRVTT